MKDEYTTGAQREQVLMENLNKEMSPMEEIENSNDELWIETEIKDEKKKQRIYKAMLSFGFVMAVFGTMGRTSTVAFTCLGIGYLLLIFSAISLFKSSKRIGQLRDQANTGE